jgi:hypothetical protein
MPESKRSPKPVIANSSWLGSPSFSASISRFVRRASSPLVGVPVGVVPPIGAAGDVGGVLGDVGDPGDVPPSPGDGLLLGLSPGDGVGDGDTPGDGLPLGLSPGDGLVGDPPNTGDPPNSEPSGDDAPGLPLGDVLVPVGD